MNIPAFSLTEQYEEIGAEVSEAVNRVLRSGHYILGPEVEAFEREMAEYLGAKYAIGVANGSDALHLALLALGVGVGDEVLVPAFTFFATAGSVVRAGAVPVFCDIDPDTFNIDISDARKRITKRTKAIIPVHLYGGPADMDGVMALAGEFGLKVIEDAAQAIGALYKGKRVCTFGDFACLSFYPTKNLGACGDAGMVLTSDDELAQRVRMLRVHGSKKKYHHELMGYNSRLDELQATILRVKLRHLDEWTSRRRALAAAYESALGGMDWLKTPDSPFDKHVYHQYTIRTSRRDAVADYLKEHGVGTTVYYPTPLHKQTVFLNADLTLPNSELACNEVLSLPMYPEMDLSSVQEIAVLLRGF